MFSDDGLFWECLDADASDSNPIGRAPPDNFEASIETGGHGISKENSYARNFKLLLLNVSSQEAENLHGSEQRLQPLKLKRHLYDCWISMVTNFTSRELSNESDRLIAMEGPATALAALLDDENVAGLWRRDFSRQLLWRVDDVEISVRSPCGCDHRSMIALWDRPRRAEQRPGLFPSWSWANINQAVTYADWPCHQSLLTVQDIELSHALGSLRGRIKIRGVIRFALAKASSPALNSFDRAKKPACICKLWSGMELTTGVFFPDYKFRTDSVVVCLAVQASHSHDGGVTKDEDTWVHSLVLAPTDRSSLANPSSEMLEFKRAGVATFKKKDLKDFWGAENLGQSFKDLDHVELEIV